MKKKKRLAMAYDLPGHIRNVGRVFREARRAFSIPVIYNTAVCVSAIRASVCSSTDASRTSREALVDAVIISLAGIMYLIR